MSNQSRSGPHDMPDAEFDKRRWEVEKQKGEKPDPSDIARERRDEEWAKARDKDDSQAVS